MEGLIIFLMICNLIAIVFNPQWRGLWCWYLLGRPTVILLRNGEMKTSTVRKLGSHYWVAWYFGIEKIELLPNGTALNPPFRYEWEPLIPADKRWFAEGNAVEVH